MGILQFVNEILFNIVNQTMDILFLLGGLILFLAYPFYFFFTQLKKQSKGHKTSDLFFQTAILFLLVSFLGVIWALPEIVSLIIVLLRMQAGAGIFEDWLQRQWMFSTWRWLILLGGFSACVYLFGREHGENRWRRSLFIVGIILSAGWAIGRWPGIVFISAPMLWVYFASLCALGAVVMPASDPEDPAERKKRVNAFISYTWGIQSPMYVVDGHAWEKYDPRVPGDITWNFSDFPLPIIRNLDWRPGLIWTQSHQVAAISGGSKFKRVDGPGVVFTGKLERLDQIFDLRVQIRSEEIEVVSKDGIHFVARYFVAFRLDGDEWDKALYHSLYQRNHLLRGADQLSYTKGSFPYSNVRIQAALKVTSTRSDGDNLLVYWDQWVMNVVEDQARQVLSQRKLDELWRPVNDRKFANALDDIANEIVKNTAFILQSVGIRLLAARVVNFRFLPKEDARDGEMDDISKQQLQTWLSEWERKRDSILAQAEAESEKAQQEARAYAEALLLNSIAEGLQKAHEINPDLPRYVIAMRFLSSLQDYVHKQIPAEESDGRQREELLGYFKNWQEGFFPQGG